MKYANFCMFGLTLIVVTASTRTALDELEEKMQSDRKTGVDDEDQFDPLQYFARLLAPPFSKRTVHIFSGLHHQPQQKRFSFRPTWLNGPPIQKGRKGPILNKYVNAGELIGLLNKYLDDTARMQNLAPGDRRLKGIRFGVNKR